jgi:hypothetical protein
VKSCIAVLQVNRVLKSDDGFAAERSLALLDSCYGRYGDCYRASSQGVLTVL